MEPALASRTFGVEFEVILPHHFTRDSAARELSRRIGKPVESTLTPSGHYWHIHNDGSVGGDGTALEFVSPFSPPLKGEDGLNETALVANALRDMGAVTNESCGTHVHIGTQGEAKIRVRDHHKLQPVQFAKNIVKIYGRFEAAIDAAMALSRHGNGSYYAKSVSRISHSEIDGSASLTDLARKIQRTSGAARERYHKVNVTAYLKHETIEFRQHGGTVEGSKIVNWVIRILQIAKAASEGNIGAGAQIALDYAAFAHKTRAVVEMISRPEGATLREICAAHGFAKISVKRQARLAGVAFEKRRGQRYFRIAGDSGTVIPATPEGLDELLGATQEQKDFWKARREAIAAVRARVTRS